MFIKKHSTHIAKLLSILRSWEWALIEVFISKDNGYDCECTEIKVYWII